MDRFERKAIKQGCRLVAGVDEAGRGPLAGPVVAASVIFAAPYPIGIGINDSKKLTPVARERLAPIIRQTALNIGIGIVWPLTIDVINIRQASMLAMARAIESMAVTPDMLLIDGNTRLELDLPQKTIVGGDELSVSIAAASIIAKTTRDAIMEACHGLHPQYNFLSNKGYGTQEHLQALRKHGPCPMHRMTFGGVVVK
ncbi:MAG: ribonuclease HII [Deltaproteobacteria bacterium]|nr:ribonuclease HII [Deltaproteobacteria bacterium]